MIFRFLFHLVLLSIFLFGSTFSCTAFTGNMMEHGHEEEIIHSHENDDCCPKDGHKKQIDRKNTVQVLQKQGFNTDPFILQNEKVFYGDEMRMNYQVSYYQNPLYDKQRLFFIKTIRLLL